jgi:cytochrome c556
MNEKKRPRAHRARAGQCSGGSIRLLAVCAAIVVAVPLAAPISAQQRGASAGVFTPLVTIKELMEKTITPATNTLWNAYEPPTEEEQWVALEEAAVTLLAASNVNALGGTGPMDDEWVQEPSWKAFNQVMINAGLDALAAIRARDHDALLQAGDVLYPPCEGCHQLFNPGVVNAP